MIRDYDKNPNLHSIKSTGFMNNDRHIFGNNK